MSLNVILDLNMISTNIFRHNAFQNDNEGSPNNTGIVMFHINMNMKTHININMTANADVSKTSTQSNFFMIIPLILYPQHLMHCCLPIQFQLCLQQTPPTCLRFSSRMMTMQYSSPSSKQKAFSFSFLLLYYKYNKNQSILS